MDELASVLLNVIGELLLGLVLRHGSGAQRFFLLFADGPARGVRDVEMEKADPDLAFAWPVDLLDPALRGLASSQLLWLWRAADVANVDLDDGSECGQNRRGGWQKGPGRDAWLRSSCPHYRGERMRPQLCNWVGSWVGCLPHHHL